MNTRRHPRTMQEAFGPYTSSRIHTGKATLLPRWVSRTAIAVLIAAFGGSLILPTACVPDAQAEAEAVAASVQDAQTAAMQEAIDRVCHGKTDAEGLRCALDTLQRLQPNRWIPEDAARAAPAVPFATTKTKE